MTTTPKSPARRFTRLTTILVLTALLAIGILTAVWFAAPGLLARKAASRVTLVDNTLLVDGLPLTAPINLFQTDTATNHVTQRQLRMAFRGAAGTLETRLGRPSLVVVATDVLGQKCLRASWESSDGCLELTTGTYFDPSRSGLPADFTTLRGIPGKRAPAVLEIPATIQDVTTIYAR